MVGLEPFPGAPGRLANMDISPVLEEELRQGVARFMYFETTIGNCTKHSLTQTNKCPKP